MSIPTEIGKKGSPLMDMRGIYTSVTKLRRQVFTEIARLAYEGGDLSKIEELPYKIVPGEVATLSLIHI